jgi:hypothetical protein
MKNTLFLALLALFVIGCSKKPQPIYTPPVVEQPTVQPEKPPTIPSKPPKHYSKSYVRGYHDGYDANWLGPVSWLVTGDYRAGWSSGQRDRKAGKPNRFDS